MMKDPKGFENGHCGNLSCDIPRWLYKLCGRKYWLYDFGKK
jgi:hypothetical protein